MTDVKKLELLAEVFECEPDELTADSNLEELGALNSMSVLSLIILMDDEFGKELNRDQIKSFRTIGDILGFME